MLNSPAKNINFWNYFLLTFVSKCKMVVKLSNAHVILHDERGYVKKIDVKKKLKSNFISELKIK